MDLTSRKVEEVTARLEFLTKERQKRTTRLTKLGQQIKPLWDLLEYNESYRSEFFSKNTGLGPKVIERCEEELSSLILQKKEKMKEVTNSLRNQIFGLWDKLCYGTLQRAEVDSFIKSDTYTEVLFDKHEEYLSVKI